MINKTRELYRKLLLENPLYNRKISDDKKREIIKKARDLKNLQKHAGFVHLQDFIEKNRKGGEEALRMEVGSILTITPIKFLLGYLKYFYVILENRAYNKIDAFFKNSIDQGEKYEQYFAKQRAKESKKA